MILVHSVVEGGIAERDNRLKVGDKLIRVNGTSVVNHSLQVGGAIAIACHSLVPRPHPRGERVWLHKPDFLG